jgi:hypothetical protein
MTSDTRKIFLEGLSDAIGFVGGGLGPQLARR